MENKGGDCRSEGLLRLINQKGAGFRFLITPVGLFQKSPCDCSIPPYNNKDVIAVVKGYFVHNETRININCFISCSSLSVGQIKVFLRLLHHTLLYINICDCRSQELLRKKSHEMPKGRGGMMKRLTLVS